MSKLKRKKVILRKQEKFISALRSLIYEKAAGVLSVKGICFRQVGGMYA